MIAVSERRAHQIQSMPAVRMQHLASSPNPSEIMSATQNGILPRKSSVWDLEEQVRSTKLTCRARMTDEAGVCSLRSMANTTRTRCVVELHISVAKAKYSFPQVNVGIHIIVRGHSATLAGHGRD